MKCRLFYYFCLILCFGCSQTQTPQPASTNLSANSKVNSDAADSGRADDTAIYGGLPTLPNQPFPPQLKRKTPNTPTALCNDGNYTFSRNVKFACNGHGGIKKWTYDSDIQIKPSDSKYFDD